MWKLIIKKIKKLFQKLECKVFGHQWYELTWISPEWRIIKDNKELIKECLNCQKAIWKETKNA